METTGIAREKQSDVHPLQVSGVERGGKDQDPQEITTRDITEAMTDILPMKE